MHRERLTPISFFQCSAKPARVLLSLANASARYHARSDYSELSIDGAIQYSAESLLYQCQLIFQFRGKAECLRLLLQNEKPIVRYSYTLLRYAAYPFTSKRRIDASQRGWRSILAQLLFKHFKIVDAMRIT